MFIICICNCCFIVTADNPSAILFHSLSQKFLKENFFPRCHRRAYSSWRNTISTITYVCSRQERQTFAFGTCAKFRQVDPTILAWAEGGNGGTRRIFAITLSSCLLRWRIGLIEIPDVFGAATCVGILCECSNPSLLPLKSS